MNDSDTQMTEDLDLLAEQMKGEGHHILDGLMEREGLPEVDMVPRLDLASAWVHHT